MFLLQQEKELFMNKEDKNKGNGEISMIHNNLSSSSIIAVEKSGAKSLNIYDIINNLTECLNNIEEYCQNKYYRYVNINI